LISSESIYSNYDLYLITETTYDLLNSYDFGTSILKNNNAKGTGPSKPRFLKRLIKQGFDVDRAKKHQNIKSLNYFIDKLN